MGMWQLFHLPASPSGTRTAQRRGRARSGCRERKNSNPERRRTWLQAVCANNAAPGISPANASWRGAVTPSAWRDAYRWRWRDWRADLCSSSSNGWAWRETRCREDVFWNAGICWFLSEGRGYGARSRRRLASGDKQLTPRRRGDRRAWRPVGRYGALSRVTDTYVVRRDSARRAIGVCVRGVIVVSISSGRKPLVS